MKNFTICLAVAIMLSGCVQRLGDFTVMSTKNMDIKKSLHAVAPKRVKGTDWRIYFIVPWGTPNLEEAADNAIEKDSRAVGLSDVTMKAFTYGILPLFAKVGYEVEGNPVYEKKRK